MFVHPALSAQSRSKMSQKRAGDVARISQDPSPELPMRKVVRTGGYVGRCAIFALFLLICPSAVDAADSLSANDIDWCGENLTYYKAVGEYDFLESQSWAMRARVCTHLYKDPLWRYEGADRTARLIDRSAYYTEFEIQKSKERAETGRWSPDVRPLSNGNVIDQRVIELEHRILELEQELKNKHVLIDEQMKMIRKLSQPKNQ